MIKGHYKFVLPHRDDVSLSASSVIFCGCSVSAQDPNAADKLAKIQSDLDETKVREN